MALAKPTIVDDPLQARRAPQPEPKQRARQPAAAAADEQRDQGDPYAGSPKVTVSMRATKALWDRLGVLSRRLEDAGTRTSRTELVEALCHFHTPQSPEEARELVLRYRRARVG